MVEPVGTGSTTAVEVYTKEGIDNGITSLQEDIEKSNQQVQASLQASDAAINEEALKRKYSVTNLEKADAAEAAAR